MKTRLLLLLLLAAAVPGAGLRAAETAFTYDAAGRLLAADLGDGAFITYAYDANGNIVATRHAPAAAPESANLAVSITYPDGPALAGAAFRAVVTVRNAGPGPARDARLAVTPPAGTTVLATTTTQGFVTAANGLVRLDLGVLAPDAAAVVELTLVATDPGAAALAATVTSPDDSTPGDNSAAVPPPVNPAVNLTLAGRAGPSPLTLGSRLVHEFTARNAGDTPAAGVVLTSRFPPDATFIQATTTAGTLATSPGEVRVELGDLPAGAEATVRLTVAPTVPGPFTNQVALLASNPELTPADNALELVIPTQTATLVVVNTDNEGPGSLRQALLDAEASPARDIIAFQIPNTGGLVPTIAVVGDNLPVLTRPVVIDGFTQAEGMVELTGLDTRLLLTLQGGDSVVRGLALTRGAVFGLLLEFGGGNVVEGCHIGCAPDGVTPRGNGGTGVHITEGSAGNRLGGPEPWQRNVIGANRGSGVSIRRSAENILQGNFLGVAADGTTPLGNEDHGVSVGASLGDLIVGNVISGNGRFGADGISCSFESRDTWILGNRIGTDAGGTVTVPNRSAGVLISSGAVGVIIGDGTPAGRNVISGNAFRGISSEGAGVRIVGNFIGTDATGTQRLPNVGAGVALSTASGAVVGGAQPGEGNVISGNTGAGIDVLSPADRHLIQGNIIGLDAAGVLVLSNNFAGINLSGSRSNLIGGPTPGAGNLISGNGSSGIVANAPVGGHIIQGNRIGTDAAGLAARPNAIHGVSLSSSSDNLVGGLGPGEGNLISGNLFDGVSVTGTTTANRIEGNWLGVDATGAAPLPNRIGVSTFSNARGTRIEGNLVSGNLFSGLQLTHVSVPGATVIGNFIGTDRTGLRAVSNATAGVRISRSPGNLVGPGNVIAGNGRSGVEIAFTNAVNNVVVGNLIGVGADGATPVPNQANGVGFLGSATNRIGGTLPGEGNVIAFNQAHGVQVRLDAADPAATFAFANAILGNAIFANGGLGIEHGGTAEGVGDGPDANDDGDADDGPNRRQNFPVLAAATAAGVSGTLNSAPGGTFRIEVFASEAADPSGFGEGRTFLGAAVVTTDGAGAAAFEVALPPAFGGPRFLTATATDEAGNTSEFSPALRFAEEPNPDSDNDGLPDAWELLHFGNLAQGPDGDFDGDGHTNRAEFILGTDPADPDSRLAVHLEIEAGLAQLAWAAAAGVRYHVEASADLADWTVVHSVTGTGGLVQVTLPAVPPARFLRLRVDLP